MRTTDVDAVVIGAGLGGLSAATFLARQGYDVLLLERHSVPGGFASSFVRGRYEFEVSLHVLSDIGTPEQPGSLRRYLDYLGVSRHVRYVPIDHLYRSVFPDLDVVMPAEPEPYAETLCRLFPADAAGIRRFVAAAVTLSRDLEEVQSLQQGGVGQILSRLPELPSRLHRFARYLFATWGEVLAEDVRDHRARAVLSQIWGYFGLPPSRVSYIYFAIALGGLLRRGACYVSGRSQALSNGFVSALEMYGGAARFNSGVRRILTHRGEVTGVVTDSGETITAKVVISNADPVTCCRELIGMDDVPGSFFRELRGLELSPSVYTVYCGVAAPLSRFGVAQHEIFLNDSYDFDSHYARSFRLSPPETVLACCYNAASPEISPDGTAIITLTALAQADPWWELPPERYVDAKSGIADRMIESAERILPGLRGEIEVVDVSTPITHMRYAGTLGGAVYGFANRPYNHTILRPGARGPLGGLYFTGAWTRPGGGFTPAIFSGNMAGAQAARQLR